MIRWLALVWLAVLCATCPTMAFAQDTDDFIFDDDEETFEDEEEEEEEESEEESEESEESESSEPVDDPPFEDDDEIEFEDEVNEEGSLEEDDLFEGEPDTQEQVLAPGADTAEIYRARQAEYEELGSDEEVMAWEAYLEEFPNTLFRERIETRIDELLKSQFQMRIGDDKGEANADDEEIRLVRPAHLSNVNPRTQFLAGLEFGFPSYIRGTFDFEYAILRRLSVHGGVIGKYQGWGAEVGAKYALVKSAKSKLVFSGLLDARLNFNELFFMVRPQIGLGKSFGPVQLIMTAGAELDTRKNGAVGIIGGAHVSARLADAVGLFVETDFHVRNLTRDNGVFAFNLVSLGMRFYPRFKKRPDEDPLELHAVGHAAAGSRYLSYFLGSVQAQGVYYMDGRNNSSRRR